MRGPTWRGRSGGRDDDHYGGGGGDFPAGMDADLAPPPPPPSDIHHPDRVVQLPGGATMMANHKPLVVAMPLDARPKSVDVKLFAGFYDVRVTGQNGERGFYHIPMRPAGSPRLVVANLAACSIGYLNRVGTVGEARKPMTDADVFCSDWRGRSFGHVVSGEDKVMEAIELFDSSAPLLPVDAPAPALLSQAPPEPAVTAQPPTVVTSDLPPPGNTTIVSTRRSARLKADEQPTRLPMLEKATLRKKQKYADHPSAPSKGLLPAAELLELAAEATPPLPRKDVLQFADACGIPELDRHRGAPEGDDVGRPLSSRPATVILQAIFSLQLRLPFRF